MKRLFRLPLTRRGVRRDIDTELAFHLEGRIEDFVARGMSREEAEREAMRRFGDRPRLESELHRLDEAARERRVVRDWAGDLVRDVRFAVRALTSRPGYAVAVAATLALGIGANTAVFSVADALLFRPPPFARPGELVSIWSNMSAAVFEGIRDHTRSFTSVASYSGWQMNVGDEVTTVRADGMDVSANLFPTLGVAPAMGRGFSSDANRPGAAREAILSDAFWRSQFGADSGIVGRTVFIEGVPRTVVGVMPASFYFPTLATQLWFPSTFDPSKPGNHWGWWKYRVLGRLKPGVSLTAARNDVQAAARGMRHENPLWDPGPNYGADASVTPLQSELSGPARSTLLLLLGIVFGLLLIACANVANLVLVRSLARAREFAVRTALGCSVTRMTRQLLTENLLLAGVGGVLGTLLAWTGVRALADALPAQIATAAPITVDNRVLLFTAILTMVSGVAFGLVPALRAARSGPGTALVSERGGSADIKHRRWANMLTGLQLALAVVLVASSGLLLRSFDALRRVDPGFRGDRVLTARVTLPTGVYREPSRRLAFLDALLADLESSPGILSVGVVNRPPLRGPVYGTAIRVEGQFEDVRHELPTIEHEQRVSPRYFETMGIRLLRGRAFTPADRDSAPWVAIVSASVARRFWPNEDAVGKHIGPPAETPWITVVGVAAEVQQDSVNGTKEATLYRPLAQSPETDLTIVARTSTDPATFASTLRGAVAKLDRIVPVTDVRSMGEVVSASLGRARFTAFLLAAFASLALTLGAIGIYGVVSFSVAQRARELGVRMALGATPRSVMRHVVGQGAALAAAGITIGLIASLSLAGILGGLLYGIRPNDALTFGATPVLLMAVALAATWMPARRAVRTDPLTALRSE